MDALDKYKKAWDNQPENTHKVSKDEIYRMSQSKSTSIVKWIFIIGLLELVLPFFILLFCDLDKLAKNYEEIGIENYAYYSQIVMYPFIAVFIYLFYKNYRSISATDTTKELMNKILKTRKTVKYYIYLNLAFAFVTFVVVCFATINSKFGNEEFTAKNLTIIILAILFFGALILGFFWLIYQLLYGILLKKLNRNYKELVKLEDLN